MKRPTGLADMNPWRKALAKHYCPTCGERLVRVSATYSQRIVLETGLSIGVGLLVLALGSAFDRLGLVSGPLAWVAALAIVACLAFPLVHIFDRFHCRPCARDFSYSEVMSRGWSLR
ncbi:MAG TPA: hypothetical protein VMK32_01300 [Burkholderiaceae bacterium]|nr:hypothetical protein [Burkholderiaceae bacterium]